MNQTVLAIDDSPEIHQILEVRLKPEQLGLHHALSADEGLRMALELLPDLILLDVDMPDISGIEVCHRLKQRPETVDIPVIFLTGFSDVSTKVRGFDAGAIDYVTKPFEPAELRARVRAALRTKRYQDLLSARAKVDALTGLRNRSYFDERMAEEVAAVRRIGRVLSLIMLDIDHFKRINDTYGHPFGDRVLQGVGETLAGTLRASEVACRYGGEEFAIILSGVGHASAQLAAERIRGVLEALSFKHRDGPVQISASFGVGATELLEDSSSLTPALLVSEVDRALYAAKAAGRNRVCLMTPLEKAA